MRSWQRVTKWRTGQRLLRSFERVGNNPRGATGIKTSRNSSRASEMHRVRRGIITEGDPVRCQVRHRAPPDQLVILPDELGGRVGPWGRLSSSSERRGKSDQSLPIDQRSAQRCRRADSYVMPAARRPGCWPRLSLRTSSDITQSLDHLGLRPVSTADRISARLGYRRDDEMKH